MHVKRLDHFTLRTGRLRETCEFFEAVAGFTLGPRPSFGFPGAWLYAEGTPWLHLIGVGSGDAEVQRYLGERAGGSGSGSVDHIAFRCTDLPQFEARLARLGIAYAPRTVPDLREHQIFVTDPNGVAIEFIFAADERASWAADASGVALAPQAAPT